jgi:hypothetical protein
MSQLYLTVLFIIAGGIGAVIGDRLARGRYRQYFCLGTLLVTGALLFGLAALFSNWPDSCLVLSIVVAFFGLILTIGNDVCDQFTGKMPKAGDWWLLDERNDIVSNCLGLVGILLIGGFVAVHVALHSNHDLLKAVSGLRSDFKHIYMGESISRPESAESDQVMTSSSANKSKPVIASAKKGTKDSAAHSQTKVGVKSSKHVNHDKAKSHSHKPSQVARLTDSV